ncbi:MAG: InlB B-repeat-containing protein [Clostridiales bacterium]|nr:InlB B-repeat-containing protein [Candidatus Cacconaster stercorequi]
MKKRIISTVFALILILSLIPTTAFAATNEQLIYKYFTETMRMSPAAACGCLANIKQESGFSPTARCIDTNGKTSYGICQWNGARFTRLKNYCASHGYSYSGLTGQLHYLQYELNNSESRSYGKIKGVPNTAAGAYTAGYNWARYFERCAEYSGGVNQYKQRGKSARDVYWPKYSKSAYHILTFDANGGSCSQCKTSVADSCAPVSLPKPTRHHYDFLGWYTAKSGGKRITTDSIIVSSRTLYAHWKLLSAPTVHISNKSSTGKIQLTWNKISGAAYYEIWRALSKDGGYSRIHTTTDTAFTNASDATPGTTYYYKVRAIGSNGGSGKFSSTLHRCVDCARPTVTVTANKSGNPVIKWDKVSGAAKYQVYRATSSDGPYTRFCTTTALTVTNAKNMTDGTTYYYKVIARGSISNADSAPSSVVHFKYVKK